MPDEPEVKIKPSATIDFKMGVVVLIFLVTCFHLFEIIAMPGIVIIPNEVLLGIVIFAVGYLWIQEIKDRRKLEIVNEELFTAQRELEEANLATMRTLIVSEEARDPYLTGHSKRVTEFAMAIAAKMNMSEEKKRHLEYAGQLHDIGKMGISDAVLHKPGKLDEKEWEIIKKHPMVSAEILAPLKFLSEERVMVKHHHERYDGKGYPDGLKGADIPLGSRIIAVADSFDAMNSKRSYRSYVPEEKIISELESARGSQLDPEIVDIFMDIIKKDSGIFKKHRLQAV